MASAQHPDRAMIDAFCQAGFAVVLVIITITAPIIVGQLYGWITIAVTLTGLGAMICAGAAGINLERWARP